jgi:catechol 2,3-dioxygenase-like lactoylglutathione lyase family enzyme
MHAAMFAQVQPILGTRDIEKAIHFYVDRLGFTLAFRDGSVPTNYIGLRRDGVELHMQFQYPHEMGTTRLRIVVDDPDALYEEYKDKDVL